jgi:pimeloyl-ACP methyl ester carboxylesterase
VVQGVEHEASKNGIRLFLWEKFVGSPAGKPVLLFVHGSSMASQPTFDLAVPGRPDSSVMDWFAKRGFVCWSVDMEGYGRSDKSRDIPCDIANGADDLAAATDYMRRARGVERVMAYGISSGALRAALFAQQHPRRVSRLALDAFVWTGEGAPTLEQRRKKLPEFVARNRRSPASSRRSRTRSWRSTIRCPTARTSTCARSCPSSIPRRSRCRRSCCAASTTASRRSTT